MSLAQDYERFQSIGSLTHGRYTSDDADQVECRWTLKHRPSNTTRSILTITTSSGVGIPIDSTLGLDDSCQCMCSRVVVYKETKNEAIHHHLEFWVANRPPIRIALADICEAPIRPGSILSGAAWSSNCVRFAFIAERKRPVLSSFFPSTTKDPLPTQLGNQFDYNETSGEGLPVRSTSVIVVDRHHEQTCRCVEAFSGDRLWCQVIWRPNTSELVAVGFENDGQLRRLGLLHYNSRPSSMYHWNGSDSIVDLTPNDHSPSWPRFSPDGSRLAYFSTDPTWLHTSGVRLRMIVGMNPGSVRTVVDIVSSNDGFPGLWLRSIPPKNIWMKDNCHLVLSTQWRSRLLLVLIDTDSGKVQRIPLPPTFDNGGSAELLDVRSNTLLVKLEDPCRDGIIMSCQVNLNCLEETRWSLSASNPFPLNRLQANVRNIGTYKIIPVNGFEAIVLLPDQIIQGKTRLIVVPHGGPHGGFTTSWSSSHAFLLSNGFALLLVNYRGSSGFGQDMLESLPGAIGNNDVDDVVQAIACTKKHFPELLTSPLVVMGGSHGGFLVLWLIAKYPDLFRAAVVRNPVTNIAHMVATTDIPDWCFVESGIEFAPNRVPQAEDYSKMYSLSPISQIDLVQTPLMMMLGDCDKRVPMSQSLDYFRLLRSRGVLCRCLIYPDNQHGLTERVDTEADQWINLAQWLSQD